MLFGFGHLNFENLRIVSDLDIRISYLPCFELRVRDVMSDNESTRVLMRRGRNGVNSERKSSGDLRKSAKGR